MIQEKAGISMIFSYGAFHKAGDAIGMKILMLPGYQLCFGGFVLRDCQH